MEQEQKAEFANSGFLLQSYLLWKKNMKVVFFKMGFLLGHIVSVLLVCGVVYLINYMTRYSYENEPSMIYPETQIGDLQKCQTGPNCSSLGYIVIVEKITKYREKTNHGLGLFSITLLQNQDSQNKTIFWRSIKEKTLQKL